MDYYLHFLKKNGSAVANLLVSVGPRMDGQMRTVISKQKLFFSSYPFQVGVNFNMDKG
jgi:hypothetical protein